MIRLPEDEHVGAQPLRSVRPIPAFVLDSILDRRPNLYERFAANDRSSPAPDAAVGGKTGLVIMAMVAVLVGILLATGGHI